MTTMDWVREYLGMGWSLCALRPGEKGPYMQAWGTLDLDEGHWRSYPEDGCGVLLGRSGLATIDVDDMSSAKAALGALGIDLVGLLEAPDAVRIVSRPGRAKLVYRVREDQAAHVGRKRALNWRTLDGTSFCVVEFRAGSGQLQDVLPPSIHPATKEPYAWAGDFRRIPGLPDELAAVWEMWDDAVRVMREADPCKAKAQTVPKREIRFHGPKSTGDVIGKWNDAYDVRDVMSRPALTALYEEVGNRWRRRGSQDKAGVVLLEDRQHAGRMRVYSHHGGDPLIAYTATDAFGLFCLAEHGGDDRAAVKAAAFELGLPPLVGLGEIKAVGEEQVQALVASAGGSVAHVEVGSEGEGGAREERGSAEVIRWPGAPVLPDQDAPEADEIAAPHGALSGRSLPVPAAQDLAAWIAGRVGAAKIGATVQTTLAVLGHLASRRYESEDGRRPCGFFGVLDSATLNLSPYLRAVDDLLDMLGDYDGGSERGQVRYLEERVDDVSTPAGMKEAYRNSARLLFGSPSFATWLEREGKQINPSFRLLLDELGWYRLGKTLQYKPPKGDAWTVRATALSALWAVAPASLGGLVRSTRGSGLLQQTVVADCLDERAVVMPRSVGVPTGVVDVLRRVGSTRVQAGHVMPRDDWGYHRPEIVPVDPAARDIARDLRDRIGRSVGASDRLRDYPLGGCARGWSEASESISVALAAIEDPDAPRVGAHAMGWAADWVWDCWTLLLDRLGRAREDSADIERAILEVLRRAGQGGATTMELRDAVRPFRALSAERRQEIMDGLSSDGLAIARRQGRGVRYYAAR
jgi:hypothetical protein